MKYLKLFEFYEDNIYYKEIDVNEYCEYPLNHQTEFLNEKEIRFFKSFKKSYDLSFGKIKYNPDSHPSEEFQTKSDRSVKINHICLGKYYQSIKHGDNREYTIVKFKDEWFLVEGDNHVGTSTHYYLCDQLEGLKNLLNKIAM